MKTHTTPVWLLAVILAWGALAAGETQAASISRCAAADGVVTYTDGRCSEMGALPAPMSLDLVRRLAGHAHSYNRRPAP